MKTREEFDEVWQSVLSLRDGIKVGFIKPGREEQDKLVLADEIDSLKKQIDSMNKQLKQEFERSRND